MYSWKQFSPHNHTQSNIFSRLFLICWLTSYRLVQMTEKVLSHLFPSEVTGIMFPNPLSPVKVRQRFSSAFEMLDMWNALLEMRAVEKLLWIIKFHLYSKLWQSIAIKWLYACINVFNCSELPGMMQQIDHPFKSKGKRWWSFIIKLHGACLLNFVAGPGELMLGYSILAKE